MRLPVRMSVVHRSVVLYEGTLKAIHLVAKPPQQRYSHTTLGAED
jgi:hypothetical protein